MPPARRDVLGGRRVRRRARGRVPRLEAGVRYDALRSHADSTPSSSTAELDVTDRRSSAEGGPVARARRGRALRPRRHRLPRAEPRGALLQRRDPRRPATVRQPRPASPSTACRTRSASAPASRRAARVAQARVSVYRSDVDDLITLRRTSASSTCVPRFQYSNVERARLEGIECALDRSAGLAAARASNAAFPRGVDLDTGERLTDVGTARATFDLTRAGRARCCRTAALAARAALERRRADRGRPRCARPAFCDRRRSRRPRVFAGMRARRSRCSNLFDTPLPRAAELHRGARAAPSPFSLRRDFDLPPWHTTGELR